MSNDAILALITLILPLLTAWALWRTMNGRWRAMAVVPLALLAVHLVLLTAFYSCDAAPDQPFSNCALPATEGLFNALRGVLYSNLTILMLLCPGLLIVAGIAGLIRKEGHKS
ncbi:hypothetical protein [Rhodalgimonas zhirmunskyi]|uniref:Uncharacterized protein n=1 Tax=Rhodalgimonas zhirmunskyi TaxID=2964767 RepID=A0AAJ1UFI2_9RHOB|nr:hypothetical protein [Rhodoalgimonas zhirmunskyi]MDQ2095291.1 hypothetical protein [Rhodoalgimonas zhirmunskyi]